ncbi:hypothetical protein [Breoghania sp. JC706]|uniref:hypothetical protein n=1 Tax=Breoghania sp. JC706 TaxID=3117732 RepID=UPI00300BAEF3
MRFLVLLVVSLVLSSCGSTPVTEFADSGNAYRLKPGNTYLVSFFAGQGGKMSNSKQIFRHVSCPVSPEGDFGSCAKDEYEFNMVPTTKISFEHTLPVAGVNGVRMTFTTSPMEGTGRYALTTKLPLVKTQYSTIVRIKTFTWVAEFAPDTVVVLPPDGQGEVWTERARESLAAVMGDKVKGLRFVAARKVSTDCTDRKNLFGMKTEKYFDCKLME